MAHCGVMRFANGLTFHDPGMHVHRTKLVSARRRKEDQ